MGFVEICSVKRWKQTKSAAALAVLRKGTRFWHSSDDFVVFIVWKGLLQ